MRAYWGLWSRALFLRAISLYRSHAHSSSRCPGPCLYGALPSAEWTSLTSTALNTDLGLHESEPPWAAGTPLSTTLTGRQRVQGTERGAENGAGPRREGQGHEGRGPAESWSLIPGHAGGLAVSPCLGPKITTTGPC